ncbi:MAG: succinoglycan biosynthesis protein ExoA, partial [Pseudonocardiales bacterium]|nr:succinoglycan biosynthesis protein ExoA [Pseudonocardiales bacterium]
FAPPALILATALTLLLPATPSTDIVGWPAGVGALGLAAYLTVLTLVTSRSGGTARDRVRFALVLAVMHYAWGSGFLRGVARGARDAVDTSRVSGRRRVATVELRQFPPVRATVDTEPVGVGRP